MKTPSLEFSFTPVNNHRLNALCGALDANLRQIEASLHVSISRRGEKFSVSGERDNIEVAAKALTRFYTKANGDMSAEEIQLGLVELQHVHDGKTPKHGVPAAASANADVTLHTRRADLRARTERQAQYLQLIRTHDITFGVGPAGTGKT